MRPTAHRDEVHFPPELGLDQRSHHDVGPFRDRILRHEGEAQAGCGHGKNPIVTLAAINSFHLRAVAGEDIPRKVYLLAIDAVEVALPIEIGDAHCISCCKMMAAPEHDKELLAKQP